MTKSIEAEVPVKDAKPFVDRHATEIHSYENVIRIALSGRDDAQSETRVSLITTARGHDGERLDAAAGCEFVDDRIRLE